MYDQKIADEICRRLALGETLRQICRTQGMPANSTVVLWALGRSAPAEFGKQYADARARGLDVIAEEIIEISDDGSNDWMEQETKNGNLITVPDHEHIARSRLRVDSRKWLLSKMRPDKYGDKTALTVERKITSMKDMAPEELEALEREVLENIARQAPAVIEIQAEAVEPKQIEEPNGE
jgi:hypothetical protein